MQLFQDNGDSPDPGPLRLVTSGAAPRGGARRASLSAGTRPASARARAQARTSAWRSGTRPRGRSWRAPSRWRAAPRTRWPSARAPARPPAVTPACCWPRASAPPSGACARPPARRPTGPPPAPAPAPCSNATAARRAQVPQLAPAGGGAAGGAGRGAAGRAQEGAQGLRAGLPPAAAARARRGRQLRCRPGQSARAAHGEHCAAGLRAAQRGPPRAAQAWACCRSTRPLCRRWRRCRSRPPRRPTWTARVRAARRRRRAFVAASTCWLPSRSSGTSHTGARVNPDPNPLAARGLAHAPRPRRRAATLRRVGARRRPGWSEGPSGRQLTADLSFKRSVAPIDVALGAGPPAPHARNLAARLHSEAGAGCARSPRVPPPAGSPVLAASFDGRHASVVWPDVGEYAVYTARPQGAWAQVARGAGAAVAWAAASDTFAVLNVPKARARRAARPARRAGGPSGDKRGCC